MFRKRNEDPFKDPVFTDIYSGLVLLSNNRLCLCECLAEALV